MHGPRGRLESMSVGLVVLTTAAVAAALFASRHRWLGWPPAAVAQATELAVVILAITGSAALAWATIPLRAASTGEQQSLSVRTPLERLAPLLRWATALCALVHVLVLSIVATASFTLAGVGPVAWSWGVLVLWALGSWAWSVSLCVCGVAVGWWFPHRWAPVLAAVLGYAGTYVLNTTVDAPAAALLTPSPWTGWQTDMPAGLPAGLRVAAAVAVGLALVAAVVGRRRTAVFAGLTVLVCGFLVSTVPEGQLRRPTDRVATCTDGRAEVCLSPWSAPGLGRYSRFVEEGLAELPAPLRPVRVSDDPDLLHTDPEGSADSGLLVPSAGGNEVVTAYPDRAQTLAGLGRGLLLARCSSDDGPQASAQDGSVLGLEAQTALFYGWGSALGVPPDDLRAPYDTPLSEHPGFTDEERQRLSERAAAFADLAPSERRDWWASHADAVASCTLSEADLP